MIDRETFKRLNDHDWGQLRADLIAYAELRIRVGSWVRGPNALPEGATAEDFVQEAIFRVYDGRRTWDPEDNPDLKRYLAGVISSLVSNMATAAEHDRAVDMEDLQTEEGEFLGFGAVDALISENVEADELKERCFEAVEGEEELETLLLGLIEGYDYDDFEEATGHSKQKLYQLRRKLKRRIRSALSDTDYDR